MRPVFSTSCVVVLALAGAATPLYGQSGRAERPYRGLFAAGTDGLGQVLSMSASAGGGYEKLTSNASQVQPGLNTPFGTSESVLTQFSGGIAYELRGDRATFSLGAGSSGRRYARHDSSVLQSHGINAAVGVKVSDATSFAVQSQVGYQPYSYSSALVGLSGASFADEPIADLGLAATGEHYVSFGGGANVSHRISRRASLSATGSYRLSGGSASREKFAAESLGGGYSFNISRGLGLRLGYSYSQAQYADGQAGVPVHSIDAGVDFNRSLSFSRRTTLSFSTGSSAVNVDGHTQFGVIGSANLVREIGRSWDLTLQYQRNVQLLETWRTPVFSDGAGVSFGGLLTRKLQFHSTARGTFGRVGVGTDHNRLATYVASTGLGFAFNRSLRVSTDYMYYRYQMGRAVELLPTTPDRLDEQSVRVSLSVWAPVFTRTRRGDASR